MSAHRPIDFAAAVVLVSSAGCVASSAPESEEGPTGAAALAEEEQNGLSWNGLTNNGLMANGLMANGLMANGLMANGLVMSALSDAASRQVLKYIVSCALPAGQSVALNVDGVDYTFAGALGLAPAWGVAGGSCDATCAEWVSSCVLSRVNYLGQSVMVSLRGQAAALATSAGERAGFPNAEAAYYGDIFSSPQRRFACTAPGSSLISRVCGPSTATCVMDVVGSCADVCDPPSPIDGSYDNCRDDQGVIVPGAVTIYRQ